MAKKDRTVIDRTMECLENNVSDEEVKGYDKKKKTKNISNGLNGIILQFWIHIWRERTKRILIFSSITSITLL